VTILLRRVVLSFFLAMVAMPAARAGEIAFADLQIAGAGLRVVTVSATTGLDIPVAVQTEFGGKQNDDAIVVEGLLAVAELSGPGIDAPIRLETAPGHKFQIPGLGREGVYFLQNIRLTKGGDFLQAATPSIATVTVSNLLQTSVVVRQLTPEELRARGISVDPRNFDVYEYTFSFIVNGQTVEIPFPVIVDKRTHEVRELPKEDPYKLPETGTVAPPRWEPPEMMMFDLVPPPADETGVDDDPSRRGASARPSIPVALVIPNSMAVLHQFFAVTLMVTNGAPAGSTITLDGITGLIKPPAPLRTVKSIPSVAFNQPVPVVDASNGVTFLVAQGKGQVEWTMEGLQPGTHTIEVEVRATYKSPGQADFPLKGTARASIVVHDARFNVNFSHPDTVRKDVEYSTYSFITNMSGTTQSLTVTNGLPACADSPGANVCRVDGIPASHDLTIPTGEMRSIEYRLKAGITGHVFASAGSVSDSAVSASVQLSMGVSESGIPLSPATLIMPYYAKFLSQPMISGNLQLLGLGYGLATAPLTAALASHPHVIKTDVFQRAIDIARAGQRVFLGEAMQDSLSHMDLDLLGNSLELREWDDLRRQENSGRTASSAVAREIEASLGTARFEDFVSRFAAVTAWRAPYLLVLAHGAGGTAQRPYALSVRDVNSNALLDIPSEAAGGWVRQLPYGELNAIQSIDKSHSGELAVVGRWGAGACQVRVVPATDGPFALEVILPSAAAGLVLRVHFDVTGIANKPLTLVVSPGANSLELRDASGGIAAIGTVVTVAAETLGIVGAHQDLNLDSGGHKVSVLWNRPVTLAAGDDLLQKFAAQISLDRDGISYRGNRPMSAAALQDGGRVANVTFDHALSQNATYSMTVAPLVDPLTGANAAFSSAVVPVIDNDAPGGIIYGHVLKGDNSPIGGADVQLFLNENAGPPQFDKSRSDDGSFLFEFVPRDIANNISGSYELQAVTPDNKSTSLDGAVRLPGRVHFVNLVFLGRGGAEGYVRYDNGEVVANASVVVGSTMFDQFRSATTDTLGHYTISDLPVGPLTFSATDVLGNVTFAASEIKTPGQVLEQDLSIFRRPFPGTASVRGVVKRSDTGAVVGGAHVGVYTQGYGLVDGLTDGEGRFAFSKVPSGFMTVLASEWTISRESIAIDFDLATNETRDVTLVLNVKPSDPLASVEGDVVRENPLFPGDASHYQKVPGAIVRIESAQAVTADANGHFVFQSLPMSFGGRKISAYDPSTTRSASSVVPQLDPSRTNLVPIFISTASGFGEGSVRVRLLDAAGFPVNDYRVIVPGFPPEGPTTLEPLPNGVYLLPKAAVGSTTTVWAIGNGAAPYGDQVAAGAAKIEFDGHVASLILRLPGQGIVRTKLTADIDVIGDVKLTYPAWEEADQALAPKELTASTSENGIAGYAKFNAIPALQNFTVSSANPVFGYATQNGKLGFDGDVQSITLQLNKLSTVRGVVYAIDGRTPVPGAAVRIEDGRQTPGIFTTLPDGSFEFQNVAAGVGFQLVADITQDGTYRTGLASGSTSPVGGPVDGVAVVLRTQGAIDGRIVYAGFKRFDPQNSANNIVDDTPNDLSDNAPVPLASFSLRELDFPYRTFGTTADPLIADISGRFSISNVFTGPLRISASDPGNQETRGAWTGSISQEGQRITAYVGIGADGFGPVTISVVDPNAQNAPVINAEVTLQRNGAPFDLSTTDGAGSVRFDEVPAGTYRAAAYSKALARSGSTTDFVVTALTGAEARVSLEFSGKVNGKLSDPQAAGNGVPGAQVTLSEQSFLTRASTDVAGDFVFDGVREGLFRLDAKDTLSNRRAVATHELTQADPSPFVSLELEPTETLFLSVYLPDDAGGNSNVLAPIVDVDVTQRGNDFQRTLQGNSFQMTGLFRNESYDINVREIGGDTRQIHVQGSFPKGSSTDPLKLVLPAFGGVEVHVLQGSTPSANAKVTVSGGGRFVTVFSDASGVALATGIPLGAAFVQVVSVDGAFSGSANTTISSQSSAAVVSLTLGAYAGVTGLVDAELSGPSIGTRVIASFGRILETLTDSTGRYTFQGIPTGIRVDLTYMGPGDIAVGARQSLSIGTADASKLIEAARVRLDATPPQVVSIFPPDNSSNISPDSPVKIVFSEAIAANFINANYLQLVPADSATPVPTTFATATGVGGVFTVTLTPPTAPAGQRFPLKSNSLYRIIVSGEIVDLTGNRLPAARGASFITSDYAEPHVIKVLPATTTALQPATTFEFRFNEAIDAASWQPGGAGVFHLYKISSAGANGTVIADLPGRAFVDPASGLSLFFAPDAAIEQESFYRVVFSGVRDLQGNLTAEQTFHFFSYDLVKPFVNLVSPVPDAFPLVSGVEYILATDVRNAEANGSAATDVAKIDFFRVDGATETFLTTVTASPWSYHFVAPDAPPAGSTLTLRAVATDLSGNESDRATLTWQVKPNQAPQNVTVSVAPSTAVYPGAHVFPSVKFEDEGTFATLQIDAQATQNDGSTYASSQTRTLTRAQVNDPWPDALFDFNLPPTLKGGARVTFAANVTDIRGLKGTGTSGVDLNLDTIAPTVVTMSPAPQTRYRIGDKYQVVAVISDLETGAAEATFSIDNQVTKVTVPGPLVTLGADHTWTFTTGIITVPAKNIDTTIPISVTAKDYNGNTVTKTVEVIYTGVNDPTVPKGAWLDPVDKGALPAGQTLSVTMQVRATDDIAVTGVKFTAPGIASPIAATRVGTSDVYEATAPIVTGPAGVPVTFTATISDANPDHDVVLPIALDVVAIDITVDDRIQAITSADVPTYENKSVLVRGTNGRLIPHAAISLKNLIVLDGARVDTLPTTTTTEQKLTLDIADHLYVDGASSIDVTARGYVGGWGANTDGSGTKNEDSRGRTSGNTVTGGPTPGASASYGGLGGERNGGVSNLSYGSLVDPTDLGTGGAGATGCCQSGAQGGGAIRLTGGTGPDALSTFAIAGAIRADGGTGVSIAESGSGGSVTIAGKIVVVSPIARITANGGDDDDVDGASRGAGGGRIAIKAVQRLDVETIGVQVQARGGRNNTATESASYLDGGAGTIFVLSPGLTIGDLFVSSFDERAALSVHLTRPTPLAGSSLQFDHLVLGQRALVRADDSVTIGTAVDDRASASVDPTAVLVLENDVPALTATTSPVAGSTLSQLSTIGVNYSATSIAGVGAVTYKFSLVAPDRVDSYATYPVSVTPTATAQLSVPFDAAVGTASLTLSVSDRAGRSAQLSPSSFSIVADTAPVIDKLDVVPASLSLYPGQSATASVSAHDDVKVNTLTFTASLGTGAPFNTQSISPNASVVSDRTFTVGVPIDTPGGQNLVLEVAASDGFTGRQATRQTKTVAILKDIIPPAVTIAAPLADALFNEGTGNTIPVRATINDAEVGVKEAFVQLDGGVPVALTRSGSDYVATLPVPNVDGIDIVTRSLTVTARDYEGNTSSPSVNIRIKPVNDPNAPVVNWSCTSSGAMYPAGYSAKLRVFALGNNVGNAANGVQKVEIFVGASTTPLTPAPLAGQPGYYEVIYAIPANAVADSTTSVRAVVTNLAGQTEGATTSFTVVSGRIITVDTTISATDASYDGQTVIVESGTLTIVGPHSFDNFVVLGGKVVHPTGQKLEVTATRGTYVGCDGALDANDLGYGLFGTYPGVTASALISAGSHIGKGGDNSGKAGATFGSVYRPQELGGGAAHNGFPTGGGGVVHLVTSTLVIDGVIRANGMASMEAAGGSVWLTAGRVSGKGRIEANGSSGGWAAGGGGAIAVEYTDPSSSIGSMSAHSDASQVNQATQLGGAGSLYVKGPTSTYGDLTLDNAGISGEPAVLPSLGSGTAQSGSAGASLVMPAAPLPFFSGHWVEISSPAGVLKGTWRIGQISATTVTLMPNAGEAIAVAVGDTWQGVYRFDNVRVLNGEALRSADPIRIGNGGPVTLAGPSAAGKFLELPSPVTGTIVTVTGNVSVPSVSATDVTVKNGAKLTPSNSAVNTQSVSVSATGVLTVESGASIDASDRGFDLFKSYPGVTPSAITSAGSHIGRGGENSAKAGATFGSVYQPQEAGGGAAHNSFPSAGGGVVRINAGIAVIDGSIRANGLAQFGGAGGSVWLSARKVAMTGAIQANGASSGFDAGGGGAIAVEYSDTTSTLGSMTAKTDASQATGPTQLGGAGSVYVKGPSNIYGDLTIDNGGLSGQPTELPSLGRGVAQNGSAGPNLVLAVAPPSYFAGHHVDIFSVSGTLKGTWRIAAISGTAVTLAPNASETINVEVGDTWRGCYRLDSVKLRNTKLMTVDRLQLTTAADIGPGSSIVGNNQAAPLLAANLITLTTTATGSVLVGSAGAVTDLDTPITLFATNLRTTNVYTVTAASDGSFAIPVQGNGGDAITLKAKDANVNPLESPVIAVGTLTASTPVPSQIDKAAWGVDATFKASTLSHDDNYMAVASLLPAGSDKLVILSIVDPAHPTLVRTVATGVGVIRDVVVSNGWAYVSADRFFTLNLSDNASLPIFTGDSCGSENAVALSGGYAFTGESDCSNNGTIFVYDVANPAAPRLIRGQSVAGFGGFAFSDLLPYGTDYLIGISPNRPAGVGHDVMVVDRRDINNLKKVTDIDIPNFDALRGTIVGTTLYVVSQTSPQLVAVDLANPAAPRVLGAATLPAVGGGVASLGSDAFVAAGTSGLATLNVANPAAPALTGSAVINGNAMDVALVGSYIYVANETGVALVPAQLAPVVETSRISMSLTGSSLMVIGGPRSVLGNMPITVDVSDSNSGMKSSGITLAADGSFAATLTAAVQDPITVTATDVFGKSTTVSLGRTPFGSQSAQTTITASITDSAFFARNVATAGNFVAVGSYPTALNGASDKIVIYDVTDRSKPVYLRTVRAPGALRDIAIANDRLYIAADRFGILDLNDPSATTVLMGDPCGVDFTMTLVGGLAFTSEAGCSDNGTINIYDVSNPATPRFIRGQATAGFGGIDYTSLSALGTDYLVAVSPNAPAGVGHDIIVLDRRDINNLRKVADFDIPGFSAFDAKLVGTMLYLTDGASGLAQVDLTNPLAPKLIGIMQTPGSARSLAASGTMLAVADSGSGVSFFDASSGLLPTTLGVQPTSGSAYECAFNGTTLYVANESGLVVIDNLALPPLINLTLIHAVGDGVSSATATGTSSSILGLGPMTLQLRNRTTGVTVDGVMVSANGAFSATIAARPTEILTIKVTDALGRASGPLSLGAVPFGSQPGRTTITPAMSDSAFFARNIATGGNFVAVASYATNINGASDKVLIFDVTNRQNPVYKRTFSAPGVVRDLSISNGWLFIAADRFGVLDLNNPTSTTILMGDPCGVDFAMTLVGGFAFTSEAGCSDNGTINIYDISNPATPRFVRGQATAGFGGIDYTSLIAFGTDYLVAISPNTPAGAGHDVIVIDRRDINNLKKIADFDIPAFNAFDGKIVGSTLYVTDVDNGLAAIDLSNPSAPRVIGVMATPGRPRSLSAFGTTLAVADGSSGASFFDASSGGMPALTGTEATGGEAWECAFNGATLYVSTEEGIAVIDNLGAPPLIDRSLITTTSDGISTATVSGAALSLLGRGPMTAELRNATTGVTVSAIAVNSDGSFAATIAALPMHALTLKVTDAPGRVAGPLSIGTVPFGSQVTHIGITPGMSDSAFVARNVSADGKDVVVASYPFELGNSDKLLLFDGTIPGAPVYKRTVSGGTGIVRDVVVKSGWAYVASDRLYTLDLGSATSVPIFTGDPCGVDLSIEMAGGYLFTGEAGCNDDGRINVYDISTPSAPRFVLNKGLAGFGGLDFTSLAALGTDYIVGMSPNKPAGVGHDVIVIDRRDVYNMAKVADLDIPGFDAFRGKIVGTTLYIAGLTGGVAIVDLTIPTAPRILSVISSLAAARDLSVAGSVLAVANGGNGIAFVDVSNPSSPVILGSQAIPAGTAWDVALSRGAMYVASELGLTSVANAAIPPMLDESKLTVSPAASTADVAGTLDAVSGIKPLTVQITNLTTSVGGQSVSANADGSFTASVAATPGQLLSIKVSDSAGRTTTRSLGTNYGPITTQLASPAAASDGNYRARRIGSDGRHSVVTSGSIWGTSEPVSAQLFIFPEPGSAEQPKLMNPGVGGIQDVQISRGYAFVVGDRLATINLSDPTFAPHFPGDPCGAEIGLAVGPRYAFTMEYGCNNDGRVNVYDVANPGAPLFLRQQVVAPAGVFFRSLVPMGTNYVIGLSQDRPAGVGHDISVLDVSDINNLKKISELEIPNFEALDAIVDGNTLYVAGGDAGVAIIDMTNPFVPVVLSITDTPGIARGLAFSGPTELVIADAGGPGITFMNIADKTRPVITGSQKLPGNPADVDVVGNRIYAASELYFSTMTRP
jgi:hypothetical protein